MPGGEAVIVSGWVDWAERVNVRQDKAYGSVNRGRGIVWHSQEGRGLQAMKNIHNGDSRQTSFMFWIAEDGSLYQFSPVSASVWTSGNRTANTSYWPVELEGVAGEPINDAQMRTAIRLIADWESYKSMSADRTNMLEHNEVATRWKPNAGPTACPSGRYDRLWAFLTGGEDAMTPEEKERLERLERLVAANGFWTWKDGSLVLVTGEEALAAADAMGVGTFVSINNLNNALHEHKKAPHALEELPVGKYSVVGELAIAPDED